MIKHNSSRIDAQQKVLTIQAMEAAESKIMLFGLGDKFEKINDRSAQKLTIIEWIHNNLKESVQQYGGIGITAIVPRASPGFVVLSFHSTSDTRHFEGTVSRKRQNKGIPDSICTQRWAISSSALTGDEESIFYIQNEVVNYYNDHMVRMGFDYQLQQHHIRMIRINTFQKFLKGKPQVLFDFLDPCDMISC